MVISNKKLAACLKNLEGANLANSERHKFGVWKCLKCGVEKPATAHQRRKVYCSKNCMSKAYKTTLSGDKNPNFKSAGKKVCNSCGIVYRSYNKTLFCSRPCYGRWRSEKHSLKLSLFNALRENKNDVTKFKKIKVRKRVPTFTECCYCNKSFRYSPSTHRKYCSYKCFNLHGGNMRAGEAAVMAIRRYGAKKDANHTEIFDAISKITAVKDLSGAGCGVPDGIAWVRGGWHLFDVKNKKTAYGRRGLNSRQKKWAEDWRGGPVFLIYTVDDAIKFATGEMDGLSRWPSDKQPIFMQ